MLSFAYRGIAALLVVLVFSGLAAAQKNPQDIFDRAIEQLLRRGDKSAENTRPALRVPASRAEIQLSFAPLVNEVSDSVVNVYAARRPSRNSPFAGDPFFERFFGRARPRNQNSLGSGVVVSANGIVVTNHHVIKDADEVKIALANGEEFEARIILKDEASDLAVLKVNANRRLQPIKIGDSENAQVGDLVLAIGNPFGVGQTVTSGIISAVARSTKGVSDFGFFLQTDAAINPGNSGGALVNMQGQLIGINTAIFSRSGGSNGIGFAIPSNMVQVAIQSSETGNILRRPWIGANFQEVTAEIASSLGMNRPRGALVVGVAKGSPAEQAGLIVGDVILRVNDNAVPHVNALSYRLTTVGIGNQARFTVLSRGKRIRRDIALMLAPETVPANETQLPARSALGGAVVANLSPALSQRVKLPSDKEGVVILSIQRGSPAAANRLRPGDIVREVNSREISRVADLEPVLKERGRRWIFIVERQGREYVLDRNGGFFRQYTR
ncbi:MAG: Do family serine endopeptidase [Pseudomonadota bacterium]